MKVIIISGTPKTEGLCCTCIDAAKEGVERAGAECEVVSLSDYEIERCKLCADGWGTCRSEHYCEFGSDGFDKIQKKLAEADALILDTPVYWGEMTELMKAFFDRFRRCEAFRGDSGAVAGKYVLLIASPGGSGNGLISCLDQMDRLSRHLHTKIFDYVGVNRWNKGYKIPAITEAAAAMTKATIKAQAEKQGE